MRCSKLKKKSGAWLICVVSHHIRVQLSTNLLLVLPKELWRWNDVFAFWMQVGSVEEEDPGKTSLLKAKSTWENEPPHCETWRRWERWRLWSSLSPDPHPIRNTWKELTFVIAKAGACWKCEPNKQLSGLNFCQFQPYNRVFSRRILKEF